MKNKQHYLDLFIKGYDQRNTVMECHKLVNRCAIAMQKDGYSVKDIQEVADKARAICGLSQIKRS